MFYIQFAFSLLADDPLIFIIIIIQYCSSFGKWNIRFHFFVTCLFEMKENHIDTIDSASLHSFYQYITCVTDNKINVLWKLNTVSLLLTFEVLLLLLFFLFCVLFVCCCCCCCGSLSLTFNMQTDKERNACMNE